MLIHPSKFKLVKTCVIVYLFNISWENVLEITDSFQAYLKESFAAFASAHSVMLTGGVVPANGAQTFVRRRSPRRRRRDLAVHQLVRVAKLKRMGEPYGCLLPDSTGNGEALAL